MSESFEKRNIGIDLAKILACFAVVCLHLVGRDSSLINSLLYFISGFAVPIFFMANGYFILNKRDLKWPYVIDKIKSILFVYILWMIFVWIVQFAISGEPGNILMALLNPLVQKGPLWHFWFFGGLIMVLLLAPLFWRIIKSGRGFILLCALGIVCLLVDAVSIISLFEGRAALQASVVQMFRLWTWCFYYVLGGMLGSSKVKKWIKSKLTRRIAVAWIVGGILLVVMWHFGAGYCGHEVQRAEYYYDDPAMMIYAMGIFVVCDVFCSNGNNKYLLHMVSFLSPLTMGIYILHPFILEVLGVFYDWSIPSLNIAIVVFGFFSCAIVVYVSRKIPFLRRLFAL